MQDAEKEQNVSSARKEDLETPWRPRLGKSLKDNMIIVLGVLVVLLLLICVYSFILRSESRSTPMKPDHRNIFDLYSELNNLMQEENSATESVRKSDTPQNQKALSEAKKKVNDIREQISKEKAKHNEVLQLLVHEEMPEEAKEGRHLDRGGRNAALELPKSNLVLKSSFTDSQNISLMQDACRILPGCFLGLFPSESCRSKIKQGLNTYDCGVMVEETEGQPDRVVGFISIHANKSQNDYYSLGIYNVCVDSEKRGQGIAKRMLPDFVKEVIKHRKLEKYAEATGLTKDNTGKIIPPLLVYLSVDLSTPSYESAFSLYAQLGFLRWWTFDDSIDKGDAWTLLIDAYLNHCKNRDKKKGKGDVSLSPGHLPTGTADTSFHSLLWNPEKFKERVKDMKSGKKITDIYMCKFQHDNFREMAKTLHEVLIDKD